MDKNQIAQATYDKFCEFCENNSLSEQEFIAALSTLKSWVNHEAREWGV